MKLEQEQLPCYLWPVTGKWKMRGTSSGSGTQCHQKADKTNLDLHKVYVDDEHYNSGHGHAYEVLGIDPEKGAMVIVRPDQCEFRTPSCCMGTY